MALEAEQGLESLDNAGQAEVEENELTNRIVTVSLLQVGLRAEARRMQVRLNELGETADTTTSDGLFDLLQQTSTLLLDYSQDWTHVAANSQTVNSIDEAEILYNQLLLREQSKFSVETLANVNGEIRKQPTIATDTQDGPTYIVVTLLMGTADDQPLFSEIYSASMLRDTLQDIRIMPPRYLLVLNTLWTPQNPYESLTDKDIATDYPDMCSIA